mmetsp:Transcript_4167/g.14956  ORF Transcript_4167/g.14956 Transcript_4167/m.14956 type:complete len:201 (-) Transcript_4167:2976-3578(-)
MGCRTADDSVAVRGQPLVCCSRPTKLARKASRDRQLNHATSWLAQGLTDPGKARDQQDSAVLFQAKEPIRTVPCHRAQVQTLIDHPVGHLAATCPVGSPEAVMVCVRNDSLRSSLQLRLQSALVVDVHNWRHGLSSLDQLQVLFWCSTSLLTGYRVLTVPVHTQGAQRRLHLAALATKVVSAASVALGLADECTAAVIPH